MDTLNDQPIFAAELVPHRSLGRRGFRLLLALSGLACLLHGGFFLTTGAWPVGLFLGLDFLLLYVAFRANYRAAKAREEVSVSRTSLSIRKFSPTGRVVEHRFNPFWARFRVQRHEEIGIVSMHVTGEGKATDIGSFLNPDDRESFAKAFGGALATVRRM
ncbi:MULTISPECIES: DUF2244 domain-containing protein [Rhizobium/Agrobacterium group]|uniref:DUF2244 domain-containing protein n=1 Tax=Agrobacterium tumefaciens TaxID=358 RepID=A0A1B9UEM2_AGRTU|nr:MULTISPECIES: DUF2244 domain-containing protein [Rhizobium/Agrobacterium group]AHK04189.1 hypothetical protein X971_4345 [Agrobacterium tumefaciens LBA4213 (Ach5)]AKC09932.1 membrane protein [Agrobacterium tumefaciens]EHJ97023.1 hypothetical protein AT5A_15716 [Agrobacterium tumefaciens 5A]MBO9111350.1 DUF2244 domain-containing protein [Agrobacterium sp. S2/73]AYM19076.1 membrane protein [Agrobacterium tumefaciens]